MNYNFIYDITQKIIKKVNYESEMLKIQVRFKYNLNLLKILTRDMKIKPGNIISNENHNQIYDFTVNTEDGNIRVAAENSHDMYVYIKDTNKGIGFRDKESKFKGFMGHYETNEGMFIISSDYNKVTIPARKTYYEIVSEVENSMPHISKTDQLDAIKNIYEKDGISTTQDVHRFKIHFYDTESMSYIEEYKNKMSEKDLEFYLKELGIFPDEEIIITASTQEELFTLANKFYLDPNNFININRKENIKENTEDRSIKH